MNDHELEQAIRTAAAAEPMPTPAGDELKRALARRARGERIAVPDRTGASASRRRPWIPGAIAAGLALLTWQTMRNPAEGGDGIPGQATLLPGTLLAQGTSQALFPRLSAAPGRLLAGSWVYTAEAPDQMRPWDVTWVYRVTQSSYQGTAAWLLLAGKQRPDSAPVFEDSTWLARDGLAALGRRRDTATTWQPVPTTFLAILQATQLSERWTGSIPVSRPGDDRAVRWMNLKVYGRESIEVPAGRFDCWKVGFSPDLRFYFWISAEGWAVRTGMERYEDLAFGKMNLVLLRQEK